MYIRVPPRALAKYSKGVFLVQEDWYFKGTAYHGLLQNESDSTLLPERALLI